MTTPQPLTGNRTFRDEVVRIAELTVTSHEIRGITFVNCHVMGPAVLLLAGSSLQHCSFDAPIDAIFWEIPPTREAVVGGVLMENCEFSQCRFTAIGFAGPTELRLAFEQSVS